MSEAPIINLEKVDIYRQDNLILQQVHLCVEPGEFVYLIGKVGTGKSSILKLINAEIPSNGLVQVLGYNLATMKDKQVAYMRRRIGVVHQDLRLLTDRTVYENLAFVLKATGWKSKKKIDARINEVLSEVNLQGMEQKMPHQMSGGEQQRTVIARAILNQPELILADEPTGNLDPNASNELMNILNRLNKQGITILMATHNYQLIDSNFSRVIHIDEQFMFDPNAIDVVPQ